MEVSGQLYAPAALPAGKVSPVRIGLGSVWTTGRGGEEEAPHSSSPYVSYYTD